MQSGVQCLAVLVFWGGGAAAGDVLVDVEVDLRTPSSFKPFAHYWKRSFGSGHAALSLRPDWQSHLKQAVDDLGVGGVRFHGIFDDDMGPVVPNTAAMQSQNYNFTLIDKTWDYQVSLGVVPLVELSFMPCVLANCSWHGVNPTAPACKSMEFHYQGVKQQPTSFEDWYNLVKGLVQHAVDRYGKEEVKKWDFEVWNEGRWMGMPFPQPYLTLFNASSRAVKSVDPSFRIGGPASANLAHVQDFVQAATSLGIPFDFVSTHHYPTDSCRPTAVGNKSVMDPDCFMKGVKASRDTVPNTTFYLTETNVGCCLGYSQHDTSAAAAFAFKTVGDLDGITDLMSWWTFSDGEIP
jgi:xylan 1,4-beta-xylosidase